MKSPFLTGPYWLGCAERALKTFAQAALAMLTGDGLGVLSVDWGDILSVAALATVASVLTSVASAGVGPTGSASLVEDHPSGRHAVSESGTARTVQFRPGQASVDGRDDR